MHNERIVVLGSGVQGLSCAVLLLHQGAKVTIVSSASPESFNVTDQCFASPKAGANWMSYVGNDDRDSLKEYDAETYEALARLAPLTQCGIMSLPAFQLYPIRPRAFRTPWYAQVVKNYKELSPAAAPDYQFGLQFDTFTMNVPKYLAWLVALVKALGGSFVTKELAHWNDALESIPENKRATIVVNCTGLGSLKLGGVEDKDLYPVRGHVLLVRAPQVKRTLGTVLALGGSRGDGNPVGEEEGILTKNRVTRDLYHPAKCTYVIPREDGTVILGGTYQKGDFNMLPDDQTAKEIMERCIAACPELVQDGQRPEILSQNVGLRPARFGDCRVDSQYLQTSSGNNVLFVNNYGHGGYGYQSSWGCAQSVVRLVRSAVGLPNHDDILDMFLDDVVSESLVSRLSKL